MNKVGTVFGTPLGERRVDHELALRDPGVFFYVFRQGSPHGSSGGKRHSEIEPISVLRHYDLTDVQRQWRDMGVQTLICALL